MFPAGDVNEWISACLCDVDCASKECISVWERGRIEGWTPGPEHQRRFEGQHQTPHQLINACRGDPDPARNNTNTSKTPSKAPSWPSSHWAIGRLWNPPTSPIDLNCCLVYHVSLSHRDRQRLQIEFGRHGMGLSKLDSHQHQCVMGVLSPMSCLRANPDYFSEKKGDKNIAFSHTGIWAITLVRYQYCFPILPAARGG